MQQENPVSIVVLNPEEAEKDRMHVSYYLRSSEYAGEAPHEAFGVEARLYQETGLLMKAQWKMSHARRIN